MNTDRRNEAGAPERGLPGSETARGATVYATRRTAGPSPWNNLITMAGMVLVIAGVLLLLTFALFSVVTPARNPYVDIVGYLVLPGITLLGAVIVPATPAR